MPKKAKTKEEKAAEKAAEEERKRQQKEAKKAAEKARKEAAEAEKARRRGANKKPQQQGPGDRKYSATSVGSASSEASPSPGGDSKSLLPVSTLVEETSLDHSPPHTGPGQTGGQRGSQPGLPPHIAPTVGGQKNSQPVLPQHIGSGQRGSRPLSPPHGLEILADKPKPILGILKQSSQPNFTVQDQEPPPIDRSDSESSSHYPETAVKSKVPNEEDSTAGGRALSPPREASGGRHQSDSREKANQLSSGAYWKQKFESKNAEVAELMKQSNEKDRIIQAKTAEVTKTQEDVYNMSALLNERNRELEKLQKSSATAGNLNKQVVELTGQLKDSQATAEQLREDLKAKSDEKQTLQDGYDTQTATITSLNHQLTQARTDHSSAQQRLQASFDQKVATIGNLNRQLAQASAAQQQLQGELEAANTRADDLTRQLEQAGAAGHEKIVSLEERLQKALNQKTTLVNSNAEEQEARAKAVQRVGELETQVAEQAKKLKEQKETELNQQRLDHETAMKELTEKVEQFEEQLTLKGREVEQLKIDHEAAMKELELKSIQQENEIEQEFTSEAEEVKHAHETAIKKLKDEHSEAIKQLTDTHSEQLSTMTLDHEQALRSQEQGYLAKLEQARTSREQMAALTAPEHPERTSREELRLEIEAEMHRSYKTQIETLEAELAEAKNSPPSEVIPEAGINKQLKDLESQYERLSAEKEEEIRQLSNEKWAHEQTIKQLEQEKQSSDYLLQANKEALEELQSKLPEIDDLRRQIEELKTDNQQLRDEAEQAKQQALVDPKLLQSLNYDTPTGPSPQDPHSDDEDFHDADDKVPSMGAPENFTDNEKLQQLTTQIDSLVQEKAELAKQIQEAAHLAAGYQQSMADLQGKLGMEQRAMARLERTKQELIEAIEVAKIETGGSISKDQDAEAKFKHLRAKFLELTTQKVEQDAKLRKRIEVLNAKVADRDEQLKRKRSDPTFSPGEPGEAGPALQSRLAEQSKTIMELRDQLTALQTTNEDLEDEVHALKGEVDAAKKPDEEREKVADDILHAVCHDYIAKLEAQIAIWKTHCEKAQAEAHSLQSSGRQWSVSSAESENIEPQFEAADHKTYSEYLQDQVAELQKENVELKSVNKGLLKVSDERDQLQQRNLQLINSNRELNRKFEKISRQVAGFKKQASAWPPVKQQLEREIEELKNENELMKDQLITFEEDFKKEREERAAIAGRMDTDKEKYQSTIHRHQEDITALTEQIENLHSQISSITEEKDKLAKNEGAQAHRITDMERQCGEQLAKILEYEKLCREKSTEISELQKTNKGLEDLLEETLEKLHQEQALKDAFNSERKTKTEQILRLQQDSQQVRAQLEADARRLREEAQKAQEESDQNTSVFTAEKLSLEEQLAKMETQLANMTAQFKAKEKNLELSELDKQTLKEQLQRSQDQVDDLSCELDDLKEKHEVAIADVRQLYEQVREKTAQVKTYSKQGESFKKQLEETAEQLHKSQQEASQYSKQAEHFRHQWDKTHQEVQRLQQLVKTVEDDVQFKVAEAKAKSESDQLAAQVDLQSAKRKIQELERQLNAVASGGSSGALQVEIDKRKALEQQLALSKSKAEELFAKCVSRNAAIDKLKKQLIQHDVPVPALDLDPHMPRAPGPAAVRRPPGQVIAQNQVPVSAHSIPRKQASEDYEHLQFNRPPAGGYASLRGDPPQRIAPAGHRVAEDSGDPNNDYENDSHYQSSAFPNILDNNALAMRTTSTGQDYINHDHIQQGLVSQAPANVNPTYATAEPNAMTRPTGQDYVNHGQIPLGQAPANVNPTYANDAQYYRGPPPVPGGGNYQHNHDKYINIGKQNKPPHTNSPPKALPVKRPSHERFMQTQNPAISAQSPTNPPAASQAGPPVPVPRRSSGSVNNQPRRPKINSDVQENPLLQNIDADIKAAVDYVIQEGEEPESMLPEAPFDPNLICPLCMRNFRVGEIQKYRKHVAECQGE